MDASTYPRQGQLDLYPWSYLWHQIDSRNVIALCHLSLSRVPKCLDVAYDQVKAQCGRSSAATTDMIPHFETLRCFLTITLEFKNRHSYVYISGISDSRPQLDVHIPGSDLNSRFRTLDRRKR
ncbi:hypothetical protein M413DRAFT_298493 [Hebeloma cylindrosporum]|uniref:Uncharacterized protein n=1 Tax=Hebeloma cylindrosporum TaxID=76867 RepID=A0A0C3CPY4_HEBCY|nr:hypothetical protein M413DRAFT_298493 [Hebeloma cylindrosporum h7]